MPICLATATGFRLDAVLRKPVDCLDWGIMSPLHPARREFLHLLSGSCGAVWLTANWPAIVSAAEHAHHVAKSPNPKFEALTAEQAREVDALAACIIPTDDSAGAR